jgi:transcriptional regulator with XRE-family HTH domain
LLHKIEEIFYPLFAKEKCVIHATQMKIFGEHIRQRREALLASDKQYSLRQVATRIGIEPAYLSKIDRGVFSPPSEEVILKLAVLLNEDTDNACSESFFHSLKVEAIHGERFETRQQMRETVFEYIEVDYNRQRLHSYLGYKSPDEFEQQKIA